MRESPLDLSGLPGARRDPVEVIVEQNATRLQDLVPVRVARMLESPFAFYRGTAALMAADLAATPSSEQYVLACGDAHLSNFGLYASPERRLVFDLNDFDEAGFAPWEWDLKRLLTSVHLAATENGASDRQARRAVRKASRAYRRTVRRLAELSELERFYVSVDIGFITDSFGTGANRERLAALERKARRKTSSTALRKLTVTTQSGVPRIVDQPPLMRHTTDADPDRLRQSWRSYLKSCAPEIRYLLRGFTFADFALRVVGVGSVGTRCFIVLLTGQSGAPLFLQVKEAGPSVLQTYGRIDQTPFFDGGPADGPHDGYRVVAAQRTLQSASDPFLGWVSGVAVDRGPDVRVDYYIRQLRDMKASVDLSVLSGEQLVQTARVCAGLLARAHAQSPRVTEIARVYGRHRDLDEQLADFAQGYAALATADWAALRAATERGTVPVRLGR